MGIKLQKDELLLGEGECSMMVGPLSVAGDLVLTTQRIHFNPSRLNKMVGVKPLSLKVSKMDKVEIVGIDRVVTISSGDKTTKFMGKWAKTVHDRLQALIAGTLEPSDTLDGFGVNERYLVQTGIDYSATSVLMVGGEITVTGRSLRFTPSTLERLMWRKLKIETAIEGIEELTLESNRRVSFRLGKDTHRFAGGPARKIYSAILAAKAHRASGRSEEQFIYDVANASIHRGVLSHPGLLVETWDGLTFLVGGALDKLVGVAPVSVLPWKEVERIDLNDDSRLAVSTAKSSVVFSTSDLEGRFEHLLRAFGRVEGEAARVLGLATDPQLKDADEDEADRIAGELVDTWGGRLPNLSGQVLALWGPALRVSRRVGCRRGHLGVFEEYVIWIPEGGITTGVNPIVLPIGQLQRLDNHDKPRPELRLRLGGGELHLLPPSRERFTKHFWEIVGERAAVITLREQSTSKKKKASDEGADVWNRRATYRVALPVRHQLPVQLRPVGTEEERTIAARLTNLSLGGAGIATAESLTVGDTLLLSLGLGGNKTLTLKTTVIHSRQVGRRKLVRAGLAMATLSVLEEEELRKLWTGCQRIEVQIRRGMDEADILPLDGHPSAAKNEDDEPSGGESA